MGKQEFLELCYNLFEEAVGAKAEFQILLQFGENSKKYNDEINYSPAFYNVVYNSLMQSMMMTLSRLYDWNKVSLTLRTALEAAKKVDIADVDGYMRDNYFDQDSCFSRQLKSAEEIFYPDEVGAVKKKYDSLGYKYAYTEVKLSLDELWELYNKRFEDLQNRHIIPNLIRRRNTVYAHNDAKTRFDFDRITGDYPITLDEIGLLIDFATDFLGEYICLLTGTNKNPEYVNIDDWSYTLQAVRVAKNQLRISSGMNYEE